MTIADKRDLVEDGLLNVEEAAAFLTLCPSMVYQMLADKRLTGVRFGKRWAVPRKALVQYAAERVVVH